LVQRSLCAVSSALRYSRPRNRAPNRDDRYPIRPGACSLLQSLTTPDCHRRIDSPALLGFVPYSVPVPEARSSRVYLTRHLPASGFLTLLPFSFLGNHPALFRAGDAHGVLPSGPFPLAEPSCPLGLGDLRAVSSSTSCPFQKTFRNTRRRSPGFKALLSARIRHFQRKI